MNCSAIRAPLAGLTIAVLAAALPPAATAATATVQELHSFNAAGQNPVGALVLAGDGSFYGTTFGGGTTGKGTIYKITPAGVLTTLLSFDGAKGAGPIAGLALGTDGHLYGTTETGGTNNRGVVFQFTTAGLLTVLHNFDDTSGAFPRATPLQTSDAKIFGVAGQGGATGNGTVWRLAAPGGAETTLFSFDVAKGQNPNSALILGSDGNFYGTTESGGSAGLGTVFKMTPTGTVSTLFSFDGAAHGANPEAALVQVADGNFFGTTENGGANNAGTVFKMTTAGVVTLLASFGGVNGDGPRCTLVTGSDGNFYGTTFDTIFRITPGGVLTTLHNFAGTQAGSPQSGLVRGTDGNFYGTTRDGGAAGKGTVFRMLPPPSPPPGLSATAGGGQVTLAWSPVGGAASYNVYQRTAAGGEGTAAVQSGITATTTTISSLASGRYFFTVTTVNSNGESSASVEASATVNVPDSFSFEPIDGATPGTTQLSNIVMISGLLADTEVPVALSGDSGAAYSKSAAAFTTATGTAANGDSFQLRVDTAATAGATTQAVLSVGRVTGAFSVTTAAQDSTPDAFAFNAVSGADPGSTHVSNAITVGGINSNAAISIAGDVGATYSVNGGPFTASSGLVGSGSNVRVRLNAPAAFNASSQATLNIGGVTGTYSIATHADTAPDAYAFDPVGNAPIGSTQLSDAVTIAGIAAPAPISVTGDAGAAYSVNGAVFTVAPGTVNAGDTVRVQVNAGGAGATSAAVLDIGGVRAAFVVTAAAASDGGGGSLDWLMLAGLALLAGYRRRPGF